MLLNVSHVSKQFGIDIVLEKVSFQIKAGEKVALVGRNGCGKSTLLKLITGSYAPDSGSILIAQGASIGYLRQENPVKESRSVLQEAESAVGHRLEIKQRLEELETILETNPTEDDLEEYALLHEHFAEAQGYSLDRDLSSVLKQMGFDESDFDRLTESLSGGEKTRLAIARLILEEPELLILDEPTNHLDLKATEWLERWIREYRGAVLLVSHDRTFLENTAQRVIEIRQHTAYSYPGNFVQFLELRQAEDERQAEVASRQAQEIAKLDEYVRRFMNSQRTAQARGRLKQMNKLKEGQVEVPKNERGMAAGFKETKRSGDIVIECNNLAVGFPDETLYKDFDWIVRFGERWGVIGENGAGKSTLIKTIFGDIDPISGAAKIGSNVEVGYFSQDTAELNPDWSPLKYIAYECDLEAPAARDLLGRFLISGDDVFRSIKTLSGGEKNKLVLARLTHESPNLLVLDEPTNHLDMASREALAKVLSDYKGTLVLISHDRWLLGQVSNHTLDVRRAGPKTYSGSYEEYRTKMAADAQATTTRNRTVSSKPQISTAPSLSPREISKEIERITKLVADLENEVSKDEMMLAEIEHQLSVLGPEVDVHALTNEHGRRKELLEGRLSAWETQASRLEELRAMQGG